jgi:hypothetical protein
VSNAIHPGIMPLAALVGTWSGRGRGTYPTIEPFDYTETVTFAHVGKPFLAYHQRTGHAVTGQPLHGEEGYLRMPADNRVELVVAHPTGLVEVAEGWIGSEGIRLRSTIVGRTGSAKAVTAIERDLVLAGDVLEYSLSMEAVGHPMTKHLECVLRRNQA